MIASPGQRELADFRVLYAEDDEVTRVLVKKLLDKCFCRVSLAVDGQEGLELYLAGREKEPFDLVITDISMPRMNGLELLSAIKKKDPHLTTVIITAYEDRENFIRAIELGVDYFLSKPVFWEKLFETADKIINRLQKEQRIRETEEKIAAYIRALERQKEELETLNRQLDAELEKARQIHERTLPLTLPKVKGLSFAAYYLPARKLGGDFYDVVHTGNKIVFYLSDVSGHGLDGAMMSVFVKNTIGSYLDLTSPAFVTPERILGYLADRYNRQNYPGDYFVCVFLGVLEVENMELRYTGAGCQVPLLLHLGSGEKKVLYSEGPPITTALPSEMLDLGEDLLTLKPGSTLLLSTDGLLEEEVDGCSSREASRVYIDRTLKEREHVLFEWLHRRKNGETFPAEIILTAYPLGGEMILHSTIRDISERKRAEAALHYQLQLEKVVSDISSAFLALPAEKIDAGINYALELTGKFFNVDCSYVGTAGHSQRVTED